MSGASHHDKRAAIRRTLLLNVCCQIADDLTPEVWLTDLAPTGCQLILRAGLLRVHQRIVIRPRETGDLPGVVRWSFATKAGIAFEHPLDEDRLEALLNALPQPQRPVRTTGFLDQFGRPLPDWPR